MTRPPEALRRHGITRVTDNCREGQEIVLPKGAILNFFREPLLERFRRAPAAPRRRYLKQPGDGS